MLYEAPLYCYQTHHKYKYKYPLYHINSLSNINKMLQGHFLTNFEKGIFAFLHLKLPSAIDNFFKAIELKNRTNVNQEGLIDI